MLLRASNLRLLTQAAEAARQLMYPFRFLHTYIPVMPSVLMDYVEVSGHTFIPVLPSVLVDYVEVSG